MNKLTKAAIAGAAGIALLLGGAGSLALWNATDTVNAGSITTGTLEMTATAGSWTSAPALWVPGDSATYSATVDVTATGDHIKGTLSIDATTVTLPSGVTLALTIAPTSGVNANGDGTFDITGAGNYSIPVTVTATFDSGADNTSQGQTIDLSGLAFRVDQHA
ncbi:alternate signal-mediated exported protein [Cryobacterium mesophilum]|uniref:Alternate-type signal peptide domain-containing protein n=1 Tax=Terrimesophilobacter mesophilus TaxID=433647 RepID=A0A4R8V975_9MICO|nr:alternate-type signal peptide domain-containing protein [Terrimesophilobacter mesophilus]MBB5632464.1 alternate signal-mediated exported protein [Terrimesophilobacter mesophilus]TFB79293.1 alternate-type signal peptide domain-containing protein [Terrimesophilobacter mesophilus]